ncbi:DHH family phosphoesterase [Streptococcus agalactiae]|uniref:DHH family phosphoesterase n=3 Tax=Streptococcus agalactiae TaxID=1311 RepID=UPI00178C231E|nr:DHH family phosphoesterase [Streptococcus agalactiae]
MKRFRFATVHLVLIGLILFGLLAICVRLFQSYTALLLAIFVALSFVVALLYYQKITYELSEVEQIELLNDQTEVSLKSLLEQMPVGVIQFDLETNDIEWFNPYAELIFTGDNGHFQSATVKDIITSRRNGTAGQSFEYGDNKYSAYLDTETGVFYFFDNFMGNRRNYDSSMLRPVIGIISIDNYDDIMDTMLEADMSKINAFVTSFISDFTQSKNIFYRRVNMDRYYIFTDYSVLNTLIKDKFDILNEFRKRAQENHLSLTLSMGISYGDGNHNQIGQIALENLNTALVRGGDQIVVRENDSSKKALYFGGGAVSTIKRSRTRTRAMMTAISDRLKVVDSVFIVGHRKLDMDALGASVGMQFFASNIVNASYVVYDPNDMNSDIERAIDYLQEDGETRLVSVERAFELITQNSLLVMVDHSKTALTLSKEFFNKFADVIVVDHHRRDEDFPKNAVLSFIESGASSASELVTELIQFQQAKDKLSRSQASILMAGIMLDTRNFASNVTSRTFDVASYLRGLGSNSMAIQKISATDFDEYRLINELILKGERIYDNIIVATGEEHKVYSHVIASKAADTMLTMAGIEATFVITKNSSNIGISARSRNNINVQRIMEKLGGGGHFSFAACQIQDKSVKQVRRMLLEIIDEDLRENSVQSKIEGIN